MENARLLDERIRRIIGEISNRTGGEIKKNLLQDMESSFHNILEEHYRRETVRFLTLLKRTIDRI